MKPVVVRNVAIGEGIPKICVPIIGRTKKEVVTEAKHLLSLPVDIVEWRADCFAQVTDVEKVQEVLVELRRVLEERPLLFTFRTSGEGGKKFLEIEDYVALNLAVAESGNADLVDVEAFVGMGTIKKVIQEVQSFGVKTVVSNHEFGKTPSQEEIIRRLCYMQSLGADIVKIAVMPQSKKDVLILLAATEEMGREYATCPVITMSMAGEGVISRLCGEVFGSALTFGAVGKGSAPGQMEVSDLHTILRLLHKNL